MDVVNNLLDNVSELFAAMDTKYNYTYFNEPYRKEFENIFGITLKIGDNMLSALSKLPEEQKNAQEIWGRALSGEEFIVIKEFGDKNRQRNVYEISYSCMKDEDGFIIGASHIVRDVTVREKLKKEAKSALEIKRRFLSNVSHELRTPLNAILGFSQLIKFDRESKNLDMYITSVIRSGKYLLSLINDTLDIHRLEDDVISFSLEPVNVYSLILEIFSDMQQLAIKNNISIFIKMNHFKGTNIYVDRTRYKQILVNLISNAIKYNKENGQIQLECHKVKDYLFIDVKDTGIGIKKEDINKLGKTFERLNQDSNIIEGTGLGLAIVKLLCNKMNGILNIDSTYGKGSVFSIGFICTDADEIEITKNKYNDIIIYKN